MGSFENKCVIVTGASSGIGRETAVVLAQEGAKLVLVGRDKARLEETAELTGDREKHMIFPMDLCDFDAYRDFFSELKNAGTVLDGLVHCAGETVVTPLRTMKRSDGIKMMDIHFFAFLELVKGYAKKGMNNGGSIVAVSAINAHTPQKCMTMYAAAKSAVESACKTLALELAEKNIRINSVVVGGIDNKMKGTDGMSGIQSDYVNPVERQVLGLGSTTDIATVIKFLLSDDARFITGREVYADGGLF